MHLTSRPDCWNWQGNKNAYGYGVLRPEGGDGRKWLAHRWAYTLFCGPIPDGMYLLHRCDNPACVNPDHLRPGTQAENLADMKAKGRQRKGETHQTAKLKEFQIFAIKADPRRQSEIAADYGISQGYVSILKSGKKWTHLAREAACASR